MNGDWSTSSLEPDTTLPADGLYSATALVANASVADLFTLNFVWLGKGTPGSQPFEVFDDSFNNIQRGRTQAPGTQPTSLPGTLPLLVAGLMALRARRPRAML